MDNSTAPSDDASANPSLKGDVSPASIRGAVGKTTDGFSQLVNENLVAARFGVFAGITLLTVYGLSQTPLFFRYRTVSEVPASYFGGRRRLYGRIISVEGVDEAASDVNRSIQIHVRHLSPMGKILPKSWFDVLMRFSPQAGSVGSGSSRSKPEENARDLLRVKIAGIHSPPVSRKSYQPEHFLERLAKQRTLVSLQLLARQVSEVEEASASASASGHSKRELSNVMPELLQRGGDREHEVMTSLRDPSYHEQQVAIGRIMYRPTLLQLFATDVAETLIGAGNASVSSSIFGGDTSGGHSAVTSSAPSKVLDASQRLQDLRYDVKYLDRLTQAEFEAAKKSKGMWSVPEVRERKREIVEEVEFQTKANILQKLWRWVRG